MEAIVRDKSKVAKLVVGRRLLGEHSADRVGGSADDLPKWRRAEGRVCFVGGTERPPTRQQDQDRHRVGGRSSPGRNVFGDHICKILKAWHRGDGLKVGDWVAVHWDSL